MANATTIVTLLKAVGEITRLRLIALLMEGELSVKDFTEILGQSQPRISRHLKLLTDAGVVTRHAEGAWAYFRLADAGLAAQLLGWLESSIDTASSPLRSDKARLVELRAAHREQADAYFAKIATEWDKVRSLHVPDVSVEDALLAMLGSRKVQLLLDLGTGTGRMPELLSGRYRQAIGIDSSREMLAIARAKIDAAGLSGVQVRLGDILELKDYRETADLITIHQVLHYFDDPGMVLTSAASCLKQGGAVLVVDFAPHGLEFLRTDHAHRRLGLSDAQMQIWARTAGLEVAQVQHFPASDAHGLTVCVWRLEHGRSEHLESGGTTR